MLWLIGAWISGLTHCITSPLLLPIRVPLIDIATLCEKREEESPVDGDVFEDYIEATWGVSLA